MIGILLLLLFIVCLLIIIFMLNKSKKQETFVDDKCDDDSYKYIEKNVPMFSVESNNPQILISSKRTNVDGPARFKGEIIIQNSPLLTFDNNVVFNNDIYMSRNKGIAFNSDAVLSSSNYDTLMNNVKSINDIFSDKYVGEWVNEEYVISDLLLENLDDKNEVCSREEGLNSLNACVTKMWKTVRDGSTPINNDICECCCKKESTNDDIVYARLIKKNEEDVILTAQHDNPAYYNLKLSDTIEGIVLMMSKSSDGTETTMMNYGLNVYDSEKKKNKDDDEGLQKVYGKDLFNLNKVVVHPFKRINNYMPKFIYFVQKFRNDLSKEYSISSDRHSDGSWKNLELRDHIDKLKWEAIYHSPNRYYFKNIHSNEFMIKKGDHLKRDKTQGHLFRLIFETKKGTFVDYYTGYFWIVHDETNQMLYINHQRFCRFNTLVFEEVTRWYYQSDEENIPNSMSISHTGIKLWMNNDKKT